MSTADLTAEQERGRSDSSLSTSGHAFWLHEAALALRSRVMDAAARQLLVAAAAADYERRPRSRPSRSRALIDPIELRD